MKGNNKIIDALIHEDDDATVSLGTLIDFTGVLEARWGGDGEREQSSLFGIVDDVELMAGNQPSIYISKCKEEAHEQRELLEYFSNSKAKFKLCAYYYGNRFYVDSRVLYFVENDESFIVKFQFESGTKIHPSGMEVTHPNEKEQPKNELEEMAQECEHPFSWFIEDSSSFWDDINQPTLTVVN